MARFERTGLEDDGGRPVLLLGHGIVSYPDSHLEWSPAALVVILHRVSDELTRALDRASEEFRLQSYYRDLVRPILRLPRDKWPECCAGRCEPCNQVLVAVASRVQELLGEGR